MADMKLDDTGKIRIGIIICALIAWWCMRDAAAGKDFADLYYALDVCIFVELVFLILGCLGFSDNDIVKLIDKILELILAIAVIVLSIICLYDLYKYGWTFMLLIGVIFALIAGCGCGSIAGMLWK